jgi:hypothetical protein
VDKSVKLKLGQELTRREKNGRGIQLLILFNLYGEYLTKDALEGFGGFKIGAMHIVKYADDRVLLAKKEVVLQGMIERQIIDHCFEK